MGKSLTQHGMTLPSPKEFGAQELLALSKADEQVHEEM